ncbi:hypothetical protein EB796_001784 [Bugula neritina]|uniref:Uncharacterized protein n=1 Tax=Bugula neritina TaxID=10212 RepID=A0A7J7KP54_BUGNE|nr:hypothetical protein EB796_001784 [Bugula neritina]
MYSYTLSFYTLCPKSCLLNSAVLLEYFLVFLPLALLKYKFYFENHYTHSYHRITSSSFCPHLPKHEIRCLHSSASVSMSPARGSSQHSFPGSLMFQAVSIRLSVCPWRVSDNWRSHQTGIAMKHLIM